MTDGQIRHGSCLCGACRFTAVPEHGAHACHCGQCRKWSGGVFMAVACGTSVAFNPDAPLTRYASSDWAERIFCARCGSSLVWQMRDGTTQMVSVQAFEAPGDFVLESQIYVDSLPGNYALAETAEMLTEAEVLAKFATRGESP